VKTNWEEFYGDDTEGWATSHHRWQMDLPENYHWPYWHDPWYNNRLTREPMLVAGGYGSSSKTSNNSYQAQRIYHESKGPLDPKRPVATCMACHHRQLE
jgi:hypothetical protein